MDYYEISKKTIGHLYSAYSSLDQSPLDPALRSLVELSVAQINGCAFCCQTHHDQCLKNGVEAKKLIELAGWQSSTLFADKERLALQYAKSLTQLECHDFEMHELQNTFNEAELVDLTACISIMNALTRIAISLKNL
ncbi:carboxymuconolactone decarboxylase family protein [Marinicellulosiphila megalodicopiae]|uniref:carboxymuconolactone decarboxylase family protein n=1 Tax=Marinicellulosiphila megalodicopiae TaxID=2724896 RepID=UPI003BB201E7